MADEILYSAAVHQAILSCELSRDEVQAVREALRSISGELSLNVSLKIVETAHTFTIDDSR